MVCPSASPAVPQDLAPLMAIGQGWQSKLHNGSLFFVACGLGILQRPFRSRIEDLGLRHREVLRVMPTLEFGLPKDKSACQLRELHVSAQKERAALIQSLAPATSKPSKGNSRRRDAQSTDLSTTIAERPGAKNARRAVILTALKVEYEAVRAHLKNVREYTHPRGTVYEEGEFTAKDGIVWVICVAEIGAGNAAAGIEAERAINRFAPEIAMFVGVAGGLKDVLIGDVVVASKVYGYERGKAERDFHPRPQSHDTSYLLQQRARAEAKREDWIKRTGKNATRKFKVFVAPIASGEKVVASRKSELARFLRENYGDALAVEMEGWGFLDAVHASPDVQALVIRGISDLIDDKRVADAKGSQEHAARNASAFAFQVLSKLSSQTTGRSEAPPFPVSSRDETHEEHGVHSISIETTSPAFLRSPEIDHLIKDVKLGDKQSTVAPMIEIVRATDPSGRNKLFEALLNYQDCPDEEIIWKALPTIEACADLAPQLVDHAVLSRMAHNPNFSVRSTAASICMDLAQYAPERVPVDLLINLSVYSEDWYVEAPANAALKAIARAMPAVLQIFFSRLSSGDAGARLHAAQTLVEIADKEPEILDPDDLRIGLARLKTLGDGKVAAIIAKVLRKIARTPRHQGYKYGI
jgi:nucleoside phosphorylase